jgi:hypothetical protein
MLYITFVKAKSAMEKYRQSQSCTQDYPHPFRMTHPRKSLSISNLFNEPHVPRREYMLKAQNSYPATHGIFSCSFDYHHLNPRISIYETDPQTSNNHMDYLKYPVSSVHSLESEKKLLSENVHSKSQISKSNLQVCQPSGGSFSFSDLDPVEEDLEIGLDPDVP